jgi:hypothetical protein
LRAEADYAFRQSFALCPVSPEAVYRYINFLVGEKRLNDAVLVARTARRVAPDNQMMSEVLSQMLDMRRRQSGGN